MANACFILSTGRTSTQNIAEIAKTAYPDTVVDHEALGPNYLSRRVFRRPGKYAAVLGGQVAMQRKFVRIEDLLAGGQSYLEAGWPVYAWLPYLSQRFGAALRFVHLVRNPFHVAASLTTHGLFVETAGRRNRFQEVAMIHVGDARVHHTELAARGAGFSPFERNLFHWLEVNQFLLEQHDRPGFAGLFRYEDLYAAPDPALPDLLGGLLGPAEIDLGGPGVDRFRKPLPVEIGAADPHLVAAAVALGQTLGYAEADLVAAHDPEALQSAYGRR